jgi:hypothetical protein
MDSKPIPVCKPIRHGRVRLLRDEGAYFGKNQAGWYFGFKLHVLSHHSGALLCAFLTPANVDDRDVAAALADAVEGGVLLADLGYRDAKELEPLLWRSSICFSSPLPMRAKTTVLWSAACASG